jgi:hypothetical protein
VIEPLPSTTQKATKMPSTKKRTKTLAEASEPTPRTSSIALPIATDEPIPSSSIPKPKPPVSKSGFPRSQVYVEIIKKKRKTGRMDGPSTVEKGSKQQGAVGFIILSPGFRLNDRQNL